MRFRTSLAAAIALLLLTAVAAGPQVELRFRPIQNGKYRFKNSTFIDTQTAGSADLLITSTQLVSFKGVGKDGSVGAQIGTEQAHVQVQGKGPQAEQLKPVVKQLEDNLRKSSYTVRFNKNAQASNLKMLTAGSNQAAGNMELGFMGVYLPGKKVGVGATWTTRLNLEKMLGQSARGAKIIRGGDIPVTYKLVGVSKQGSNVICTIRVHSAGSATLQATQQTGGTPNQMAIEIKSDGTITLDAKTGIPLTIKTVTYNKTKVQAMTVSQKVSATIQLVR